MQKRDGLLLKNARDLRKNMTKEERHLWYDFLCRYPIRFRRQEIIEPYIADFYCSQAGLVVELDGSQHYEESGKTYDAKRTALFEEKGIIVLRYSNADVTEHFESVCEDICSAVNKRIKASPARGGGPSKARRKGKKVRKTLPGSLHSPTSPFRGGMTPQALRASSPLQGSQRRKENPSVCFADSSPYRGAKYERRF